MQFLGLICPNNKLKRWAESCWKLSTAPQNFVACGSLKHFSGLVFIFKIQYPTGWFYMHVFVCLYFPGSASPHRVWPLGAWSPQSPPPPAPSYFSTPPSRAREEERYSCTPTRCRMPKHFLSYLIFSIKLLILDLCLIWFLVCPATRQRQKH